MKLAAIVFSIIALLATFSVVGAVLMENPDGFEWVHIAIIAAFLVIPTICWSVMLSTDKNSKWR